jgi:hypothetical protein
MLRTIIHMRVDLLFVSLPRRFDLIGFSHPKARYFLLLRQKKVSKEKATQMPLASCALVILSGFARRDIPIPLAKRGFLVAPHRAIPDKITDARRGIRDKSPPA